MVKRPLWLGLVDLVLKIGFYTGNWILKWFFSLMRLMVMLTAVGMAGIICLLFGCGWAETLMVMAGMMIGIVLMFFIGCVLVMGSDWYRCRLGLKELS